MTTAEIEQRINDGMNKKMPESLIIEVVKKTRNESHIITMENDGVLSCSLPWVHCWTFEI